MAEFNLKPVEVWPQFNVDPASYPGDPLSSTFRSTFGVDEDIEFSAEPLDIADFEELTQKQIQQDINQFKAELFITEPLEPIELISLASKVPDMLGDTPRTGMIADKIQEEATSTEAWADKVASMRNPVTDSSAFMGANTDVPIGEIINNKRNETQSRYVQSDAKDIGGQDPAQAEINNKPTVDSGQTSPGGVIGPGQQGISSGEIL